MPSTLRIISIGAHPADVFDQSGGTMAHHAAQGDYVACVVLTHGARDHDKVISDSMFHRDSVPIGNDLIDLMKERSEVKAEEVRAAGKILGFEDVYFLEEDDAVLLITETIVKKLAKLLRKIRPDIVLTHYPKEGDGITNAHAIAGQIALYAMNVAGGVDPDDPSPPTHSARTFFFGSGAASLRKSLWDSQGGYYNDVFVDISDVVEKKLAALDCLASQGYGGAYARKRIETNDGAFGISAGVPYAEGFIASSGETHYTLPVSDYSIQSTKLSDHERMAKYSYRIKVD